MKYLNTFYLNKICLLAVLFFSLYGCSNSNKGQFNDWQRMNLKGNIKQIDIKKYATYEALLQKLEPEKSFVRFDENGLITQNATFLKNEQIHWIRYDYREDSVYLKEVRTLANKTEHPQAYWWYKLDERGAQIAITSILLDSSINFHIDMETNEDGNATEIIYSKQRYPTYMPCRVTKIYDENGKIKEELTYPYSEITRKCEEQANRTVFKLNQQGDVERETTTFSNGQKQVHSYQYQYDEQGNWTQKIHYAGDIAEDVVFRTFSYYKSK